MSDVREQALQMLADMGVTPGLGGLIPEDAAAKLLMYSHSHFRQLAARGMAPITATLRGNRRFYKLDHIVRFFEEDGLI